MVVLVTAVAVVVRAKLDVIDVFGIAVGLGIEATAEYWIVANLANELVIVAPA